MSRRNTRRALALLISALAGLAIVVPAHADTGSAVVAFNLMYLPGDAALPAQTSPSITSGQDLVFANADASCLCQHTFTSKTRDSKGHYLFDSGLVDFGSQLNVPGVPELKPGTYPFFCQVHPTTMSGALIVN